MYKPGVGKRGADNGAGGSPMGNNSGQLALGDGSGRRDDSGSGSDESEESDDSDTNGASGAKDMWKQLCIMPQGSFFASNSLTLELRQEYTAAQGKIQILWRCKEPLSNIRAMLPDVPHMRFKQDNQVPSALKAGQEEVHNIQVQCLRPFLQPANYLVEFTDARGKVERLPLMMPAVMTKFIVPAEMQMAPFRQHFESMQAPDQEGTAVGTAKVPPNQWQNYISKGFNLYLLQDSNQTSAFAAGTFNTATPDPSNSGKNMAVPCMVRLDFQAQRRLTKITVRSQHAEVTQPLLKILETYLCEPS